MNNIFDNEEKELLALSCFDYRYESEIPNGYHGIYLANPKNRVKRFKQNHAFVEWLATTHSVTFFDFKEIKYGLFYIFKIDKDMEKWAEDKMKELSRMNKGIHFKSCQMDSWGDYAQG